MTNKIKLQYDKEKCDLFNQHSDEKLSNRNVFLEHFDFPISGLKILDIGCGGGIDLAFFSKLGASVYGIDNAPRMVELASKRAPQAIVTIGNGHNLPYPDAFFDVVFTKYVLWHLKSPDLIYQEVNRVLKPKGFFLFLTCHPIREFLTSTEKNYFEQNEISTTIFDSKVTVHGYSHCLTNYLSPYLLSNFKLEKLTEGNEPTDCSRHADWVYPGYLIARLVKN